MSPLLPPRSVGRDPRIFCIFFNTKSCILVHFLATKMGTTHFLKDPYALGEMKTAGRCCWMRPEGSKLKVEGQWRSQAVRGPGSTVTWGPSLSLPLNFPFPSLPLPFPSSSPAQPLPMSRSGPQIHLGDGGAL